MSKEETIKNLKKLKSFHNGSYGTAIAEAIKALEQQVKTGEWIEVEVCNCYATLKCSVCDRVIKPTFTYGEYSYNDIKEWYPYCHCGANMGGGEDAE